MSDSLQRMYDSIAALKAAAAIDTYYDSSAVARAKADPLGTIYKNEWRIGGKPWTIHPFIMSLLVLTIVIISFYVVLKTAMLRDHGTDASGAPLPVVERPYSYSRSQLYWWTMIIVVCFVLFFIKTWDLLPFNITCITLLGLGATVHLGGRILDQKDLQDNNVAMGSRKQDEASSQRSFFRDLLTDGSGLCVHRFQSLIFNVVFGIGFVSFFAMNFAARKYPFIDFSEWQLALLGISSATYLGIKATENGVTPNRSLKQQPGADSTVNRVAGGNTVAPQEEEVERNTTDFEQ
ncbi:MAG: hypothetical protein KDC07_07545 [Chitinophagaceae bacterium]|nr:hypothetical protein [Chitinophagaceae bacterium]